MEPVIEKRVRDMIFADLYLGHPKMGNRLSEVPRAPTNPIVAGPELNEDLKILRALCDHRAQDSNEVDFRIEYDDATYRVAILESVNGTVYVLRRIPPAVRTMHELGVPQVYSRKLMQEGMTGLVIIAGPMNSGKTTFASALFAERLVAYGGVGVTAEDPVELQLEGSHGPGICFQTKVSQSSGGYAGAIRNLLRTGGKIIFLGEIRDGETAVEVLRAGVNGHLVITTMHAEDIHTALRRLAGLASEMFDGPAANALLADGIAKIVHLRLSGDPRRVEVEMLDVRGNASTTGIIRNGFFERLPGEIKMQMVQSLNGRA